MNEFVRGIKALRIASEYFQAHAKGAPKQVRDGVNPIRERIRKIENDLIYIQSATVRDDIKWELRNHGISLEEKIKLLWKDERVHLEYMVDQMLAPRSEEKEEGEE